MPRCNKNIKRAGFTLIEITIALLVLAIGLLGLLALFPVGFDSSRRSGEITEAALLAQSYTEALKEEFARIGLASLDNTNYQSKTSKPTTDYVGGSSQNLYAYDINIGAAVNNNYKPVTVTIFWPKPSVLPVPFNLANWTISGATPIPNHYYYQLATYIYRQ